MMISIEKEERILTLLGLGSMTIVGIAAKVGVTPKTVRAVRDNRESRAAIRKSIVCEFPLKNLAPEQGNGWERQLQLERLLGQEGRKFVYIVRDIVSLDAMRVIHHPLFASLVTQSHNALNQLPVLLKGKFCEQEEEN